MSGFEQKAIPATAEPPLRVGAVITAAGRSSRMGAFKPLLPLGESTVIRLSLTTLAACGVSPIVVVIGREASRLQAHIADLGVETVENPDFDQTDMFFSACLGLRALQGRCRAALFLPVDSPLFTRESVLALKQALAGEPEPAVAIPVFQGRKGHPVLLAAALFPELLAFSGPGGMKRAIAASHGKKIYLDLADPGLVMDADDREAYEEMLAFHQSRCQK